MIGVNAVAVFPMPEVMAEKMAAKKEGKRKWKITLLDSMTPFLLMFLLKAIWHKQQRKLTPNPIAMAPPVL